MLLSVEDALVEVELLVCASLCVVAARDALVTRRTGGSGAPRVRPPLHRRLRLLKERQREVTALVESRDSRTLHRRMIWYQLIGSGADVSPC